MPGKITVRDNGPLRIEGDFELCDASGAAFSTPGREYVSLCRCGGSGNKPFCDGTHTKTGFQSQEKARVLPPPPPPA
jgi:CDGSH-type Zn-finger protein